MKTRILITTVVLALAASLASAQDPPRFRWENFTTANGLPDNHVFSVLVDGDRVWAGTENGLAVYQNHTWKTYTTDDGLAHRCDSGRSHLLVLALREHERHLPVVEAIEDHENAARSEKAHHAAVHVRAELGQLEPEHVHWRRGLHRRNSGQLPYTRVPSVGANRQQRPYLGLCFAGLLPHTTDRAVLADQVVDVRPHLPLELRVSRRRSNGENSPLDVMMLGP